MQTLHRANTRFCHRHVSVPREEAFDTSNFQLTWNENHSRLNVGVSCFGEQLRDIVVVRRPSPELGLRQIRPCLKEQLEYWGMAAICSQAQGPAAVAVRAVNVCTSFHKQSRSAYAALFSSEM